uniref:RNA helicase n=1 Tax=Corethron hystrix TaxID=216773 RepID=A0A7S1FQB5_9STRA
MSPRFDSEKMSPRFDSEKMSPRFDLRPYQKKIVDSIRDQNVIVLLPTGAGKTVIPAEHVRETGKRTLFLVPTVNLVHQQAKFIREWCGAGSEAVGELVGGKQIPDPFLQTLVRGEGNPSVLVSTPKAFLMAQERDPRRLCWNSWDLVVFDEVHHVLKEHPYRKIALSVASANAKRAPSEPRSRTQMVGLTASLSYSVSDAAIKRCIRTLMTEMQMDALCTATPEELLAGGYHSHAAAPEIALDDVHLEACPPADRKPHLMLETFWRRVEGKGCTEYAEDLLRAIKRREGALRRERPSDFRSPLAEPELKMADWGVRMHKMAQRFDREDPGVAGRFRELEQWYESLRILIISWEENREGSVLFLKMMLNDDERKESAEFFHKHDREDIYVRLTQLKKVLLDKTSVSNSSNADFCGIVFVQQRVTAHIIDFYLKRDRTLSARIKSAFLYAVSSPATPSLSLNKGTANSVLHDFRKGKLNLLVSTVVAEEGLDVPSANCVIRFDPVLNAVSHVQGRGRARQELSSFVVLQERKDRPTAMLQKVEEKQLRIASSFHTFSELSPEERVKVKTGEIEAQKNRETSAMSLLGRKGEEEAYQDVLQYCAKTKAELGVTWDETDETDKFLCHCTYESETGSSVEGIGKGKQKKIAKKRAAWDLINKLKASVPSTTILQEVEEKRLEIASCFDGLSELTSEEQAKPKKGKIGTQKSKELSALSLLGRRGEEEAYQDVLQYCVRTKVILDEAWDLIDETDETGIFLYYCTYESETVSRVVGSGKGKKKKIARNRAAWDLVNKLKALA